MSVKMSLTDAKLYCGGTLVTNVKDLSLKMKKGEAKVDSRASKFSKKRGGLIEIEVEWEMNDDATDASLTAILNAFINNTSLAFNITDGSHGITGDFEVFGCDREEKLEDAITYKINIKPCPSTNDLVWA